MKFVQLLVSSAAIILLQCVQLQAQSTVRFEQLTFEEAMAKAKKEKKFIFTDVGRGAPSETDLQLQNTVFAADSVVQFFSTNLICIKINMNSEEGKKFAPRLAMLMYPAYVFYDENGNQLAYTNAGTVLKSPGVLMEKARVSLKDAIVKQENKRSIQFNKSDWETLLALAKKENKLIFLDAHTEWCRPCIMMAKDVFTLNNVADFYNKSFINTEMDMEKGQGPALAKKYNVNAYPTFLYINGDGELVSRDGGYQEADKFIAAGKLALEKQQALQPNTIPFGSPLLQQKSDEQEVAKKAANGSIALIKPAGANPQENTRGAVLIKPAGAKPQPNNQGAVALLKPAGTTPSGANTVSAEGSTAKEVQTAIHFETSSWNEILAEAKRTGKLIFLDAHTSWCGPCKVMKAEVFTDPQVGALYNRNFINAYIDMEKGEGPDLQKKYDVRFYPTLLYINGDGELVHKTVGSCPAEVFIQNGLDALSPTQNIKSSQARFEKAPSNKELVFNYLRDLRKAYETQKANTIALKYLESQDPSAWLNADNWELIKVSVTDPTSSVFRAVVAQQPEYENLYGKEIVAGYIHSTYQSWAVNYITKRKDPTPVVDEAGFNTFIQQVQNSNYSRKEEIISKSQLTIYGAQHKWEQFVATVNSMIASNMLPYKTSAGSLYHYAYLIDINVEKDKKLLQAAANWLEKSAEQVPNNQISIKTDLLQLQASLQKKLGNKKVAASLEKQITELKAAQPKDDKAVPMMRMRAN